jgi:hypothetical protein
MVANFSNHDTISSFDLRDQADDTFYLVTA